MVWNEMLLYTSSRFTKDQSQPPLIYHTNQPLQPPLTYTAQREDVGRSRSRHGLITSVGARSNNVQSLRPNYLHLSEITSILCKQIIL